MDEKKEALFLEYQNIKQEIFTLMTRIDQLLVIEYTVAMAFLGIGIEKESAFSYMLVLIFMIPIQEMINSRRRHMARASAYIQKVIEEEIRDLKWEKSVAIIDSEYNEKHFQRNVLSKGYRFLTNNAALMIAIVSYCLYLKQESIMKIFVLEIVSLTYENLGDLVGALVLFGCLLVIVKQSVTYSDFGKLREEYMVIMDRKEIGIEIIDEMNRKG